MEIVIGIIVVVVLVIVIGKMKGAPEPSSMSEAAIFQRLRTEGAWIEKYLSQPFSTQQGESLKKMYEEKTQYVLALREELTRQQMAQGAKAVSAELAPIHERTAQLVSEGKTQEEATAQSLKEWSERNK